MTKRRKRSIDEDVEVEGVKFHWTLRSEPHASTGGKEGLSVEVQRTDGSFRNLLLIYPFPKKGLKMLIDGRYYSVAPAFPIRPALSSIMIEAGIRQAMADGWNPASRGRAFVFHVQQT
jgi:hypothetical protein